MSGIAEQGKAVGQKATDYFSNHDNGRDELGNHQVALIR
jgi:hypothetical protein